MNQIKYILSACLILLMISMGIFLYKTFPESGLIAESKTVANYNSPPKDPPSQKVYFSDAEIEGKSLFNKNCKSCHSIEGTDNLLAGFENLGPWKNRKELYKWIRDPQGYILQDKTGYTAGLKEKFGVSMLPSPHLSDTDIDKIIDYMIKANSL